MTEMKKFRAELPIKYVANIYGVHCVTGTTLARRTQERNWLLLRLKNMYHTAKNWEMYRAADQIKAKILEVRVTQKIDAELTEWYRRQLDSGVFITAKQVYTKRHKLRGYWNYKLARPETTND